MNLFKKISSYFKSVGIVKTLIKVFSYLIEIVLLKYHLRNKLTKEILSKKTLEERFEKIYVSNFWADNQSNSGSGSSLEGTKNIRIHLPLLIKKFNIKTVIDAPCGDMNWMSYILKDIDINYHGLDIVEKIIFSNNQKFKNNALFPEWKEDKIIFSKKDITIDKLPKADLLICRDCLFHFSNNDILLFLNNFISSDIKYLLLTSHLNKKNDFKNTDIITGDYRLLDFFSSPFNYEKNYIYSFDDRDCLQINNFKQMYLFTREQLEINIKKINFNNFLSKDS